jgi:phospholipid/cholesterol/gamma-HCH transport system substrate-binding protein
MKRSIFGLHQLDEIVGAVVLACIGVFIAVLINAGLLKDWFQPSFTLRILLPDEGVSGLAPGAEVQVLGTRAGEVRRIVIDPNQRMHAVARVEDQMRPFIRRDSKVSIRRQFGVAGAAFIDISRGTGPELDWSYAVIAATTDRAATDTLGQMIDELRAKIMPLLDEVQKAVVAFTAVAQRAIRPGRSSRHCHPPPASRTGSRAAKASPAVWSPTRSWPPISKRRWSACASLPPSSSARRRTRASGRSCSRPIPC